MKRLSARVAPTLMLMCTLCGGAPAALGTVTVTRMGTLAPADGGVSTAWAVNANGTVVVGDADTADGSHAFRWTQAGGMVDLGVFPGVPTGVGASSTGRGVSGDGAFVAGQSNSPNGTKGYRWTQPGGLLNLGTLNGSIASSGMGISADGSRVCGSSASRAFRWTSNGAGGTMENLGLLSGFTSSQGKGISGDGTTVVGYCSSSGGGGDRAFRWVSDGIGGGVMQDIGTLPGITNSAQAFATNADGNVVVGITYVSGIGATARPFRWVSDGAGGGTMQSLGLLAGTTTGQANSVNGDGTVVVGYCEGKAFVWTQSLGIVDLNVYLPTLGVDLTGWTLRSAYGVSADGTAIVGGGMYNGDVRGFVVQGLPVACAAAGIGGQPQNAIACPTGSAAFHVVATGSTPNAHEWQVQTSPGVWSGLGNDPMPLPCGGGAFAFASPINSANVSIGIRPCPGDGAATQQFQVRCVVTNECGSIASNAATYTVCPADFDCSGGVQVSDIFGYLNAWFAGDPRTDVDGGGIAVSDIFAFLSAWFVGCS